MHVIWIFRGNSFEKVKKIDCILLFLHALQQTSKHANKWWAQGTSPLLRSRPSIALICASAKTLWPGQLGITKEMEQLSGRE